MEGHCATIDDRLGFTLSGLSNAHGGDSCQRNQKRTVHQDHSEKRSRSSIG